MAFENLNMRSGAYNNTTATPNIGKTTLIGNIISDTPVARSIAHPLVTFYGIDNNFSMSEDDLSKGILVIGSTGSGKTTIFKIAMDQFLPGMTQSDVAFIFDSKGDFIERYYKNSNESIVISANPEHAGMSKSWNIFGELFDANGSLQSADTFAKEISSALFKGMENPQQPFFHMAAADLFTAILDCFCKMAEEKNDFTILNNSSLIRFINSATTGDFYNLIDKYPEYHSIHSYLGNPSAPTTQALGVLSHLHAMVKSIFIRSFRESSPNGQFSIRRLMREKGKKCIFLEYDVMLGNSLSPIYSLFYDLAVKEAMSVGKGNTYFIADEMHLIPHCTSFQNLVNFGRSKGCKTIVGLQSINQLYNNYGEHEGKSIASGFVNAFCMRTVDYDTREFISERFGNTYDNIAYGGMNTQRNGRTVEDSDIRNLKTGEAFIDLCDSPPFKFRFKKI